MTPIDKLKGITPDEASVLEQNDMPTVEKVWVSIGKDEREIERIGNLIGGKSRLVDLLTSDGLRESRNLGDSWIARHWLDLVLGLVLLLIFVFMVRSKAAMYIASRM